MGKGAFRSQAGDRERRLESPRRRKDLPVDVPQGSKARGPSLRAAISLRRGTPGRGRRRHALLPLDLSDFQGQAGTLVEEPHDVAVLVPDLGRMFSMPVFFMP